VAIQHEVAGKVIVTFTMSGSARQLGYTRDGAMIVIDGKFNEIPSDDYGGAGGAPSDRQFLGGEAIIQIDLTKYDRTYVHALTSYNDAGAVGVFPAYGSLMRQDSLASTLLLDGEFEDWTFTTAYPIGSQEFNKGTRYSSWQMTFVGVVSDVSQRALFTYAHV
jgi:hypothetical protein